MSERSKKPTHNAYTVKDVNGKNHWTRIGSAWQHLDASGLNIPLDAFQVDGRIAGRKMSRSREIELKDADGRRHHCLAEVFTQSHQVFVLIHSVTLLTKRVITI